MTEKSVCDWRHWFSRHRCAAVYGVPTSHRLEKLPASDLDRQTGLTPGVRHCTNDSTLSLVTYWVHVLLRLAADYLTNDSYSDRSTQMTTWSVCNSSTVCFHARHISLEHTSFSPLGFARKRMRSRRKEQEWRGYIPFRHSRVEYLDLFPSKY
jgi:hypothetical protein